MKKLLNKKLSAILSLCLAFALVLGIVPAAVFAVNNEESSKLVDIFYEEIVNEYYDDVYSAVYDYAVKFSLVDDAIAEIDKLIELVEEAKAQIPEDVPDEIPEELPEDWPEEIPEDWMEQIPEDILNKIPEDVLQDLLDKYGKGNTATFAVRSGNESNDYTEYVATIIQLREETDLALTTLNELKAILTGDDLTTFEGLVEAVDYVQETLPERIARIEILWILVAEDSNNNIDPDKILDAISALEKVEYELENTVVPAIDAALEAAAAAVYDPACSLLGIFLDKQVGTADEIMDALGIISEMSEEEIKQRVEELVEEATHEDYLIDNDSHYVAFGNVYGRKNYVAALAQKLDVPVTNHTNTDMTLEYLVENLAAYKADIEKADLITLNFSEIKTFVDVVNNVATSEADYDLDWERYLGEDFTEVEEKVDSALSEIYAELSANGVDGKMAESVVEAVKAYVYRCVAHAVNLHKAVEEIKAINADAIIVVVGAYNPLSGTTYNHNGEIIEFGAYIDYIFDAFGIYDLAYAVVTDNVTYVDAPDVDVLFDEKELDAGAYVDIKVSTMMPSEDGHEYIKEQIWNALNITVDKDEECDHNFGDWVVTDPASCGKTGTETQTCTMCGTPNTREIPALTHEWFWVVNTDPSCDEEGVKHEQCKHCGEDRINKEDPLGHDWHWVVDKEATDKEDGLKHEECKRCGAKRSEGTVIPSTAEPPKTSDPVETAIIITLGLITAGFSGILAIVVYKRKFFY